RLAAIQLDAPMDGVTSGLERGGFVASGRDYWNAGLLLVAFLRNRQWLRPWTEGSSRVETHARSTSEYASRRYQFFALNRKNSDPSQRGTADDAIERRGRHRCSPRADVRYHQRRPV